MRVQFHPTSLSSAPLDRIRRGVAWAACLLLLMGLSACGTSNGGDDSNTPAFGSVSLFITDAPSDDFDKILVTLESIELLGNGPKVTIFSGEETIDLKDLENFSDLFVYADQVPVGLFSKIRLGVTKMQLVREGDDAEFIDVKPPAHGKLDLIPDTHFEVHGGVTLVIEIDFDVEKSIHLVGAGNGKYLFRPVVFIHIEQTLAPSRLSRVHGIVTERFDDMSFELCTTEFMASSFSASTSEEEEEDDDEDGDIGDRHRCMTVEYNEETGIFASSGDPTSPEDLVLDEEVTVIGRFHHVDDTHLDSDEMPRLTYHHDDDSDFPSDEHRDHHVRDDDSEPYHSDLVLIAYIVEIGPTGTFRRLKGLIDSELDDRDRFEFALAPGQDLGDESVITALLQDGTRLFSRQGIEIDESEIIPETRAKIDGVLAFDDDDSVIYKTALLFLAIEDDRLDVLRGLIVDLDSTLRRLVIEIDESDEEECVELADDARIFLIVEGDDGTTRERGRFADLAEGMKLDAYGHFQDSSTCFSARVLLAFPAPPADPGLDVPVGL